MGTTATQPCLSVELTDGAGHEVDPGRLHLDIKPVAVCHEQPWLGKRTRARDRARSQIRARQPRRKGLGVV